MSFTRFNYDDARTHKKLQESTDPSRYILNTPGNYGETPLFYEDPHIRLQKWGGNLMTNPVDIMNDLDGRMRKSTKYCKETQFPHTHNTNSKPIHGVKTATSFTDETRASHPAWMYRDLEQTRWEYPIYDPQENVCKHFYNNVSSRIIAKDEFNRNPMEFYNKMC